ncbi:MAG: T9SS type A sorting domain-containing protein [Flavobacteriales bacterium]|nr:T9SS type A sorting domain-containing protein [Flavobacteriales bacterium]
MIRYLIPSSARRSWPALLLSLVITNASAQAGETLVLLTAEVQDAPPTITLHWSSEPAAPFYRVYRKALPTDEWQELVELPASATSYTDTDVEIGDVWEYSVLRSSSSPIIDTVCMPPGTTATFIIEDTQGDGLCCFSASGAWRIEMCDDIVASGAQFGSTEEVGLTVCGTGTCTPVIVHIDPDHYPGEISWRLEDGEHTVVASGAGYRAPGFGYVRAGIKAAPTHSWGSILLLVDAAIAQELTFELQRLRTDLIKDGWVVRRADIPTGSGPMDVKAIIADMAMVDTALSALLLIGDLPVAYSGRIAPDGHTDHYGAWPADVYYAELDGPWTDEVLVVNDASLNVRNMNFPGDGKFDQSVLPSDVDLMMGRIDLSDLPVFAASAVELIRAYLDRDHVWRSEAPSVPRRAMIDFNFPFTDHDAPFRRGATAIFGETQVTTRPYFETLAQEAYLWTCGAGPGSYTGAQGVGTSSDFASTAVRSVFAHLFGSYFADWDTQDNFLRAGLASGDMLGTVWGRQHLVFHDMALGAPIGRSILRTQNATFADHWMQGRLTETALMGDPTLTAYPVPAVPSLVADSVDQGVSLNWTAPDADPTGYHVYRQFAGEDAYVRLTDEAVIGTTWFDEAPPTGEIRYMVRAMVLDSSASGTFHVLSAGAIDTTHFTNTVGIDEAVARTSRVRPNPTYGDLSLQMPGNERAVAIDLFDLRGRPAPIAFTRTDQGAELHTSAAPGTYLLRVLTDKGPIMERIVIQ